MTKNNPRGLGEDDLIASLYPNVKKLLWYAKIHRRWSGIQVIQHGPDLLP
jgi:hypothetical protein